MVKATDSREGYDVASVGKFDLAPGRSVAAKEHVWPVAVVELLVVLVKTHPSDFGRQARAYAYSLPHRRYGFSADNLDALGERPNVVAFLMAVVGSRRAVVAKRYRGGHPALA